MKITMRNGITPRDRLLKDYQEFLEDSRALYVSILKRNTAFRLAGRKHTFYIKMKNFLQKLTLVACLLFATDLSAAGLTLYVSPDGDNKSEGSLKNPLRTIDEAQKRVRAHYEKNSPKSDTFVYLKEGTYHRTEPLVFEPMDSGTKEAKVKYVALDGKKVLISGGKLIEGEWSKVEGKEFYELKLPNAGKSDWEFNNLYVAGESRERARTPNANEPVFRAEGYGEFLPEKTSIKYFPGQFDPTWTDVDNIDIVLMMTWTPVIHSIKKIYPEERVLQLQSNAGGHQLYWFLHNRYFLANVYEALDYPGEWYLNRNSRVLSYYPMPGEKLEELEFIAPALKGSLVEFRGDPAKGAFVEHLEFHGIQFSHTDTDRWKFNGQYRQGHGFLSAGVTASGLRHSVFRKCVFNQIGDYAIELGAGCSHNTIIQSHISDIGAGGILIGEKDLSRVISYRNESEIYDFREAGYSESEVARMEDKRTHYRSDSMFNTVENNIINKIGTYWIGSYGINNRFASYSKIVHNEIFDTHWNAISSDARWGHKEGYQGENYSHSNVIAYNHLHQIGRGYTADAGAIYQFGPLDTHVHHNKIHDTYSWQERVGFKGIYFDQQSQNGLAEYNLLYNIDDHALNQNFGLDIVYRNNIVAFAVNGLSRRNIQHEYFDYVNSLKITNNIYISRDGKMQYRKFNGGGLEDCTFDHNLYFDLNGSEPIFWEGLTFEDYQKETGFDKNSLIADPGMSDPANYDFTIPVVNDALKAVGFEKFDDEIAKAGLYGDKEWTELPKTLKARPKVPQFSSEKFHSMRQNFKVDFELQLPGRKPLRFRPRSSKAGGDSVEITEKYASSGKRSLVFSDQKNSPNADFPTMLVSMEWTPVDLMRKSLRFSFKAMNDPKSPIPFKLVSEGSKHGGQPGLSLEFDEEGNITANGERVIQTEPGTWVDVSFEMGMGIEPGAYKLAISNGDKVSTVSRPLEIPHEKLVYLRFESPGAVDGEFYIDDVTMAVQ